MRPFVGRRVLEVGAGHRAADPLPVDARARPRDRARSRVRRAAAPHLRRRARTSRCAGSTSPSSPTTASRAAPSTPSCARTSSSTSRTTAGRCAAMRDVLEPGRARRADRARRCRRSTARSTAPSTTTAATRATRSRRSSQSAGLAVEHVSYFNMLGRAGLVPERARPAAPERARGAGAHQRLAGPVAAPRAPLRPAGRACRCSPSPAPGSHRAWPARVAAAEAASPARRQPRQLACRVERRQLLEAADRAPVDEDLRHGAPAGALDDRPARSASSSADVDLANGMPRASSRRLARTQYGQLGVV